MPDHWASIDEATQEHPFRLVAAPARQFLNSSFTETESARKMEKKPEAQIHADTLDTLGIASGDKVTLGNRLGQVTLDCRVSDGVQKGTVIVECLWPNYCFEQGLGINALISSDPGQPNGGAVYHDTAVWIRSAETKS